MKTVKVRIAVAVDPDGKWAAHGWPEQDDETAFELVVDDLKHGEYRYFLTAELAVPEIAQIEAEAEGAE